MKEIAKDVFVSEILSDTNIKKHRKRVANHIKKMLDKCEIKKGKVLEIGAHKSPCIQPFPQSNFEYCIMGINENIQHNIPAMYGDITNCPHVQDNSYDVILSIDVFEHIMNPWKAASEIYRILKPKGMVYTLTVFSWRYHKSPNDYWRFTPDALELIFSDFKTIEKGFDHSGRRKKIKKPTVPKDKKGSYWSENWRVFYVGTKE